MPVKMRKPINLPDLKLDWRLAVRRVRKDIRDDFWPDPLGFRDIMGSPGSSLDTAVRRLEPQLAAYHPRKGISCPIPKANFTIRDAIQVTALDRVVYQALVDRLIPHVDRALSPTVFSHRLRGPSDEWMFLRSVQQWKKSLHAVKDALLQNAGGVSS